MPNSVTEDIQGLAKNVQDMVSKGVADATETLAEEIGKSLDEKMDEKISKAIEEIIPQTQKGSDVNAPAFVNDALGNNERQEQVKEFDFLRGYFTKAHNNDRLGVAELMKENRQYFIDDAGRDISKAAFSGETDGQGGFVMPYKMTRDIHVLADERGYARTFARTFPMSTRKEKYNKGAKVTATHVNEVTAVTPLDATAFFTQGEMSAEVLKAAAFVGQDWLEDIDVNFLDYLKMEMAEAVAKAEDMQFFNGTGSPFTGICNLSGTGSVSMTTGNTAFTDVSWTDINRLAIAAPSGERMGGALYVPSAVFGALANEIDVNGRPIWNNTQPANIKGALGLKATRRLTPSGYTLVEVPDEYFPSSTTEEVCAIFANLQSASLFGTRSPLRFKTYDQQYAGEDLSGKDEIALEVRERYTFGFPLATKFTLLQTAAS